MQHQHKVDINMETKDKVQLVLERAELIYNMDDINAALDRMGEGITQQLSQKHPLILCVMTGALITTGHLVMRLAFPLEIDYIHVTRYRGSKRGGDLHWLVEPRRSLKDRAILIVDDIMDGGLTLAAINDYCKQAGARSIQTAVLVSKNRIREEGVHFEPDFVGLKTEDKYLFGFGLDYDEYLRNAPGIYAINDLD